MLRPHLDTIKYRFFIPRLDLLNSMTRSRVFSEIDFRNRYHHIYVREGDGWKIAFKIKDELYEWIVIPFGLSNALSSFKGYDTSYVLISASMRSCIFTTFWYIIRPMESMFFT